VYLRTCERISEAFEALKDEDTQRAGALLGCDCVVRRSRTTAGTPRASAPCLAPKSPPANHSLIFSQVLNRHAWMTFCLLVFCACGVLADTISGTIRFEKREIDANGFTGVLLTPVAGFMEIEVRDHDNLGNPALVSGKTAVDGSFALVYDSTGINTVDIHILARGGNGGQVVLVQDSSAALQSAAFDNGAAGFAIGDLNVGTLTVTYNATNGSDVSGAFNIAQVIIDAAQALVNDFEGPLPGSVTVQWEDGVQVGTYFIPGTGIFLYGNGSAGDTDEFDDAVIAHEYGHFLSDAYSKDDSPGGAHSPGQDIDLRLSWSEGWAGFFSSAVRNDDEYRDTVSNGTGGGLGLRIDYQVPKVYGMSGLDLSGSDDEIAVAATLLDIFDTDAEAHDGNFSFSGGLTQKAAIWDVVDIDLPSAQKISIEDFWDGWFGAFTTIDFDNRATMDAIADYHGIEFFPDSFEDDGSKNKAVSVKTDGTKYHHTFYFDSASNGHGKNDEDWSQFTVEAGTDYTIETLNLANAADTVMTLYDTDGSTVLDTNDDFGGTLRSLIVFTTTEAGTLFVKVIPYAGQVPEYGAYDFKISIGSSGGGSGDSGGGSNGNGLCFIASAAYGSPLARSVQTLRAFRAQHLYPVDCGREMAATYHALAPSLAGRLEDSEALRAVARDILSVLGP